MISDPRRRQTGVRPQSGAIRAHCVLDLILESTLKVLFGIPAHVLERRGRRLQTELRPGRRRRRPGTRVDVVPIMLPFVLWLGRRGRGGLASIDARGLVWRRLGRAHVSAPDEVGNYIRANQRALSGHQPRGSSSARRTVYMTPSFPACSRRPSRSWASFGTVACTHRGPCSCTRPS
jgi:hypothetical protein